MEAEQRAHLTSALCAVVDGPLVSVLAHNAIVDADAAVYTDAVFNQLVLICLELERKRSTNEDGWWRQFWTDAENSRYESDTQTAPPPPFFLRFPPYQLAEFAGQLLDHHTQTFQLLKHADEILTGEATDHLQVLKQVGASWDVGFVHLIWFYFALSQSSCKMHIKRCRPVEWNEVQQCLPLVLCPVYSVLMAEEPLRFFRTMVSVETTERQKERHKFSIFKIIIY